MNLFSKIRGELNKEKLIDRLPHPYTYSTGFDIIDLHNAAYNKKTRKTSYGLAEGRMFTIIGRSGSAKTTLSIQIANNICRDDNGDLIPGAGVFHFDAERATKIERIINLTDTSQEELETYYELVNGEKMTVENFYETIDMICDIKRKNRKDIETPIRVNGEDRMILPPTVVILDTLAMLMPEKTMETDELAGQMVGSQTALRNNQMFKRLNGPMAANNIILILLNHVTEKISINPMQPVQSTINYLKPNESMPGGSSAFFLSDYFLRLDPGKKIERDKDFGIKGFHVRATVIKSRGQPAGKQFEMIYDQNNGFINELSNFNFFNDNKRIMGAGRGQYLDGLDTIKFTKRNFLEKLMDNEELQDRYFDILDEEMEKYVSDLITE